MADVDLRRLQRAWQNDPDDLGIASEYIRELERASDIPREIGRIRDFEVGYAPPIELNRNNVQDRLLWERLAHFAEFMNIPEGFMEGEAPPTVTSANVDRWLIQLIVPTSDEVIRNIVGPEGPGYEGPRYRRIDPSRESGDVAMRRAQRQATMGDPRAQQRYERMRERRGLPPDRRNPIKTHRTTNGYKIYAAEWGKPASFTWKGSVKPQKPFSWLLMDTAGEVVHISNADENGVTYQDALDLAEEYSQDLPSQYFITSGKPRDEYPYEFTPRGHGIYITEWGTPSLQWAQWLGPRPEKSFYWIIRDLGGSELASSTKKTAGVDVMDAWYKALDVEKRLPSSL